MWGGVRTGAWALGIHPLWYQPAEKVTSGVCNQLSGICQAIGAPAKSQMLAAEGFITVNLLAGSLSRRSRRRFLSKKFIFIYSQPSK